jgi:hypothetical protein
MVGSPGKWVWFALGIVLLLLIRSAGVRVGDGPDDNGETPYHGQDIQVYSLYGEVDQAAGHFPPSGWLLDITMIQIDSNCPEKPQAGANCIKITYQPIGSPKEGKAEILWQLPENVWGGSSVEKVLEPSRLVFWARGKHGGEQAEFQAGGFGSAIMGTTGMITLTSRWQEFEISLTDLELSHLSDGFCFRTIIPRHRAKSTIYLDEIRMELTRTEELYIPEDPADDEITILSISAPQP